MTLSKIVQKAVTHYILATYKIEKYFSPCILTIEDEITIVKNNH